MGIIKYLKEELESPNMMAGRSNIWYDRAKGGFEVFFKVDGITYSFLAESEGEEYNDGNWKIQMRKKWAGNTENVEDTKEVQDAFTEALVEWVTLKNPTSFFWIQSELYPSYNNIAKALAKKIKDYTFVDESTANHDDQKFDVIEEAPETQFKRFIFTKNEIKEDLKPEDWFERKLGDNDKTFGVWEQTKDIEPNDEHTTPFPKSGKLDKGVNYTDKKLA